ncbi:MAG: UDP-N-acetylmuramoyl-tripeptide--D-alanyl-D-alanine ligase [Anaerolineae bacterium]|nr:UDP-N-acetylmuramoyl-tripeptide--D-alanyl-D-alanine ligase [Anaerolineae bacterium]
MTGSVGKTTTKEVVADVLGRRYRVVRSQRSFNNELGLPLTLLNLTGACERVVLEMGMYVQGDIRSLCDIARPHVGIVTNVASVHAEHAGTLDDIAAAKRELVEALPEAPQGVAILNFDDVRVREMARHTRAAVFTYGLSPDADLWADDVEGLGLEGIRARLHFRDEAIAIGVPHLGRHSIYGVLRGAAAGLVEGLGWDEIVEGLAAPGAQLRLVTVRGLHGCLIIDDTFNSSPPSAIAALDLLADLDGRKVAVLGDMLELGAYEREGHLEVGHRAAEVVSDLVVVGARAQTIAEGAVSHGLPPEHVHEATDSVAAVDVVKTALRPGDVVLIKGSHAVRMEGIVSALRIDR